MDRDSSVGVVICYGLDGPRIESPCRERFSAPVQVGPGAHPASCTMGSGPLSRGQIGRGMVLTTHSHITPRVKKEQSYTSTPPLGLHGLLRLKFTLQAMGNVHKAAAYG